MLITPSDNKKPSVKEDRRYVAFMYWPPDGKRERRRHISQEAKGIQQRSRREEILSRLERAGLELESGRTSDGGDYVLIGAAVDVRRRVAERLGFRLKLDELKIERAGLVGNPSAKILPFKIQIDDEARRLRPYESIYGRYDDAKDMNANTSLYEQQSAISSMNPTSESTALDASLTRLKLIKAVLELSEEAGGCGLALSRELAEKGIGACGPLHSDSSREAIVRLARSSILFGTGEKSHEEMLLDAFRGYLGEDVAMYLAFLEHQSRWLVPLAMIGLLYFVCLCLEHYKFDRDQGGSGSGAVHFFALFFPVSVAFWAVAMVEQWKRRQSILAFAWGTLDSKQEDVERYDFYGIHTTSSIDGRPIKLFPHAEQRRRRRLSALVMVAAVGIVICGVSFVIAAQAALATAGITGIQATLLIALINTIQIEAVGFVYRRVAYGMNSYENHRFEADYNDALITKFAIFHLINYNASLIYIAFAQKYLEPRNDDVCRNRHCRLRAVAVANTLLFLTKTVSNFAKDALSPYLKARARSELRFHRYNSNLKKKEKRLSNSSTRKIVDPFADFDWRAHGIELSEMEVADDGIQEHFAHVRRQHTLQKIPEAIHDDDNDEQSTQIISKRIEADLVLDPIQDRAVFDDYDVLATRFAFTTLFVTAMPLMPLLVLIANQAELFIDSAKLLYGRRRAWPRSASSIGAWLGVFQTVSVAAVLTNGGLVFFVIGWSPTSYDDFSPAARVWCFLLFQHSVFGLMVLINLLIDDIPFFVQLQLQRQHFINCKLIDVHPDADFDQDNEITSSLRYRHRSSEGNSSDIYEQLNELTHMATTNTQLRTNTSSSSFTHSTHNTQSMPPRQPPSQQLSEADAKQKIIQVYKFCNPDKLWELDGIIKDYKARGHTINDLWEKVRTKYGAKHIHRRNSGGDSPSAAVLQNSSGASSPLHQDGSEGEWQEATFFNPQNDYHTQQPGPEVYYAPRKKNHPPPPPASSPRP